MDDHFDIAILGAGPAGLMAGIEAYHPDNKVVVLEKMRKPALKLRISGKGRCNITNEESFDSFLNRFGKKGRFLKFAFSNFFNHDLLDYLHDLNVPTKLERGGRYFPQSDRATDIVDAFVEKLGQLKIPIVTQAHVTKLTKDSAGRFVIDMIHSGKPKSVTADQVCITTGGLSYPATGSTGEGYFMAQEFGHTVTDTTPSLVPVLTAGDTARKVQGVSLRNVTVSVWSENKKVTEMFGEMMFMRKGITGPIILTLSELLVSMLDQGKKVDIQIDLKPALDHKKLDQRLLREISQRSKQSFKNMLKTLLPRKMIALFLEILEIDPEKELHQVTGEERKRLRMLLKEFPMQVIGHDSYDHAIVTSGGVSLKEIDPLSMQSRLTENLYFAGEVMDVNGETGGYNLTSSWSTAHLAGRTMRDTFMKRNQ
ncbi:MAG: NAD(P)/FAD-dependent oxidoreductase [Candidatus Marinimicrobia bacterium]|nr:NAD(P)/FAD-dependent oxidoreductase [Candidatus Neomarinimicrobiota bacterium]MCF7905407.1 NAD(P)/FAD-dependent oxidoreductase [Candidatus Neomarinimicrobiota bacterium]